MYLFLFVLQTITLITIIMVYVGGKPIWQIGPSVVFFCLHAFFYYLFPQLGAFFAAATPGAAFSGVSTHDIMEAQTLFLSFLIVFFISRFITGAVFPLARAIRLDVLLSPSGYIELITLHTIAAAGLISLIWLGFRFVGIVFRSEGIAGITNQLLFSGSLLCHFYIVLVAFIWVRSGHIAEAIILIGICMLAFMYLGGRARAVLLVLYFIWLLAMCHFRVRNTHTAIALVLIGISLPLWENLKSISIALRTGTAIKWTAEWSGFWRSLLTQDTASTFNNLALVIGANSRGDGLPGLWFMKTFYPDVLAMGVQLNLGVVGEIFVLAGSPAVILLAALLGSCSWLIDRAFIVSRQASIRLFCMIFSTWSFAIGWNLLDSALKIFVVMCGPMFWLAMTWHLGSKPDRRLDVVG